VVDFAADWGGSDTIDAGADNDIFITKINADGTYGWTHTFGGSVNCSGKSVAVDGNGNVYIIGLFSDIINFAADWSGSDIKTNVNGSDIFITKINANGTYGWTHRMGGTGSDQGNSVAVDTAGNIYLTGSFNNTVNFGADFGTNDSKSAAVTGADVFVSKINANGTYGWTHRIGGTSYDYGYGIAVDLNGNVFVTGTFNSNSMDFGADFSTNDVRIYSAMGNNDIFVTKINADETYGWTRVIGDIGDDTAFSIAADINGDVYVTGYFNNTVYFLQDWIGTADEKIAIWSDAFVIKVLSDGSYGWAKEFGGVDYDRGNSITVSKNGEVYFTGSFYKTVNFADDYMQADYKTNAGSSDSFVTKINADGTYGWAKRFGGFSDDIGYGVAVDGNGAIYLTGVFMGTNNFAADFGGSDVKTNSALGSYDIFITKIAGW